ncbi:hypothetical protein KC853_00845 [Candidatus Saccharibacteria bacterium]|nr:hypothetical protein [Candidatus Saccharibacteria bacterium]
MNREADKVNLEVSETSRYLNALDHSRLGEVVSRESRLTRFMRWVVRQLGLGE